MPPHPLKKFEIQKIYQNKLKFNGVYSRNDLSKIKDGEYIINLDKSKLKGTHWIAFSVNPENVTYFDKFWVEHVSKQIEKFAGNKNITMNL